MERERGRVRVAGGREREGQSWDGREGGSEWGWERGRVRVRMGEREVRVMDGREGGRARVRDGEREGGSE